MNVSPADPPADLQLGHVVGAHGVRGALRVRLFNAESSTLAPGSQVELRVSRSARAAACTERYDIVRVAPKPGSDIVRLWLAGVADRDAAQALRGRELWVDRAALPELDEGEFYLADLIGRPVVRVREGRLEPLGEVSGVTSNSAQDLLCVRLRGREWLVPAIPPFIVDVDERGVVVDVHDDMLPSE